MWRVWSSSVHPRMVYKGGQAGKRRTIVSSQFHASQQPLGGTFHHWWEGEGWPAALRESLRPGGSEPLLLRQEHAGDSLITSM